LLSLLTKNHFLCIDGLFLDEFAMYLRYVRSLDFTDKPDYGYLRNLFYDILHKHSWECDWQFDWIIQQKVRTSEMYICLLAVFAVFDQELFLWWMLCWQFLNS